MISDTQVANIPQEWKDLDHRWALYKLELLSNGKTDKQPLTLDGRYARWKKNPDEDLASFKDCLHVLNTSNGKYDGLGFVLCEDEDYIFIDFDGQSDPVWIKRFNSYTETSQSGNGVHVYLRGQKPGDLSVKHEAGVEMYDGGRFCVVTGNHIPDTPLTIEYRQDEINAFYRAKFGEVFTGNGKIEPATLDDSPTVVSRIPLDDSGVLQLAQSAKDGDKFRRLYYDGDISGYASESEAVFATLAFLKFYSQGNRTQIERLFRDSAIWELNPEKRERLVDEEIEKIINKPGDLYGGAIVIEPDGTRLEIKIRGCDDIANVERFYDRYGEKLRYITENGRFVEYDGTHWAEISTTAIKHRALEVSTIIRHEAAEAGRLTGNETEEQRKRKLATAGELSKWARTTSFKERIKAIVELFKGFVEVNISMFDRNPLIFNCENGVYDVPTGTFTPGHTPEDYCTHLAGPYVKGAKNAKWEAFKEQVLPASAVREFLKRATGYSATGLISEEALFYLYGKPRTGRSTFIEAVRSALGSYGKAESINTFLIKGDGSQSRPRPEILRLSGARFVRCIESNKNTRWDAALLNTMISGEPYATRALFSNDPVEVEATFKIWVVSNHRVKADYDPEEEDGFWRRLYPVHFEVTIPEDATDISLKSYFIHDPDARAAILAEILEGATEWYKLSNGGKVSGLTPPDEIIAARYEYKAAQSPIYDFLKNECIIGDEFSIPVRDLWDVFSDQRKGYDIRKVKSSSSLGRYLKGFGFEKDTVNNVRIWLGLRLLKDDEEPANTLAFNTLIHLEGQKKNRLNGFNTYTKQFKKEVSKCISVCDQSEIAQTIRETMAAWPASPTDDKPSCDYFITVVSASIRRLYPDLAGRNIEYEIKRLRETDTEIQAILAERTNG
jgi:putative DNA primase/helicase